MMRVTVLPKYSAYIITRIFIARRYNKAITRLNLYILLMQEIFPRDFLESIWIFFKSYSNREINWDINGDEARRFANLLTDKKP